MSRLSPENKALIRAAVKAYGKEQGGLALAGMVFFPLLFLLGRGEKAMAEKMDLGPRSTRVFLRVLASRRASQKVKRAA